MLSETPIRIIHASKYVCERYSGESSLIFNWRILSLGILLEFVQKVWDTAGRFSVEFFSLLRLAVAEGQWLAHIKSKTIEVIKLKSETECKTYLGM